MNKQEGIATRIAKANGWRPTRQSVRDVWDTMRIEWDRGSYDHENPRDAPSEMIGRGLLDHYSIFCVSKSPRRYAVVSQPFDHITPEAIRWFEKDTGFSVHNLGSALSTYSPGRCLVLVITWPGVEVKVPEHG